MKRSKIIAIGLVSFMLGAGILTVLGTRTITDTSDTVYTKIICGINAYDATYAGFVSAAAFGGTITLPAGIIRLTGDIDFISNTKLTGQGNNTIIQTGTISSGGWLDATNVHNIEISNLQIIGSYGIQIKATSKNINNFKIKDVDITYNSTTSPSSTYPFYIVSTNFLIENISFLNCRVLNSTTYGWMFHGSDLGGDVLNNILLENCCAHNCGRYNWVNNWVTGFSVEDPTSIENMTFINCKAEGCRESGFHFENEVEKKNIKLIGCTSNNNSKKGWNASYGAGYLISSNVSLIGCSSMGNKAGVTFANNKHNGTIVISDFYDYKSRNGSKGGGTSGKVFIDGLTLVNSIYNSVYFGGTAGTLSNVVAKNMNFINPGGSAGGVVGTMFGENGLAGCIHNCSFNFNAYSTNAADRIIYIDDARDCTFSGYIKTDGPMGIYCRRSSNVTFTDLIVDACGDYGIDIVEAEARNLIKNTLIKNSNPADVLSTGIYRGTSGSPIIDKETVIVQPQYITTTFGSNLVYTVNWGNTTVANNGTITHLCWTLPTAVFVTSQRYNMTAIVTGITSTTFRVAWVGLPSGDPPGTTAYPIYWRAIV